MTDILLTMSLTLMEEIQKKGIQREELKSGNMMAVGISQSIQILTA